MNLLDRPKTIAIILAVAVLGYAGWTFYQQTASNDPDQQVFVREGVPPHRLNLWIRPQPVTARKVNILIGYDFVNLMNDQVDGIRLKLTSPEGHSKTLNPTFSETGTYAGRYHVRTKFDQTGTWTVLVRSTISGTRKTTSFDVSVSE